MRKIIVAYEHDTADLSTIEIGLGKTEPKEWTPALRDIYNGRRVVWIKSESDDPVWVRDREGVKKVRAIRH